MLSSSLPRIDTSGDQAYWDSIQAVTENLRDRAADNATLSTLCELSRVHPEWPVRAAAVQLLGERFAEHQAALEAIASAIHDQVDWVAFTAIKVSGERRIGLATRDLIRISGWPSNFTRPGYARKPVGCGAAFTKHALLSIFGSQDPAELRQLENNHFADLRQQVAQAKRAPDHDDVVHVPAGPFIAGATVKSVGPFNMDDTDNALRAVDLPAFLIDRTTVTNRRYNKFLADAAGTDEFDHPDQPARPDHASAHRHDPRFNAPDLPVVGVDWYDAWAFAKWAGAALPSEDQWEKAARGVDGRVFPWGNDWDPSRANYVERAFQTEVHDLAELERLLRTVTPHDVPAQPVLAADSLPSGASPYGLLHMAGNVWEMTRTNFFTRKDMDPFFKSRQPVEFMNRQDAFFVLRGGTWTSPPVCLTTYYRGKDLITDVHNEIGFRCVYPAD